MAVVFPEIDPYEILEVSKESTPIDIKKSFKRLCLKHHPDKIQQQKAQANNDSDYFAKVQFSYSILSDPIKRQRFDSTGSLNDVDVDDEFNWKEYFESINNHITIEMIDEDRVKYQNSEEERSDILSNFVYYEGDFLKLFEVIPHLEFDEQQEDRVFKCIEIELGKKQFADSLDPQTLKAWDRYRRLRKTKVKQMLKKLAKEAKEADKLASSLKLKGKRNISSESDLKLIIQSRQSNNLDSLINSLEAKYVDKKGKKRANRDLSDDEFERIQKDLMNQSKRKRSKS
ncbi:uncharacterized protein PRCAT00002125001 [Priceomyces carsonii]|uniref:uncharacterized protein n=1 Tax=Priceomyces carsonii TaxID=28549 RepID=UPI002EDAB6B8|nr:unnamed protein product [Priceomyces carsonii]